MTCYLVKSKVIRVKKGRLRQGTDTCSTFGLPQDCQAAGTKSMLCCSNVQTAPESWLTFVGLLLCTPRALSHLTFLTTVGGIFYFTVPILPMRELRVRGVKPFPQSYRASGWRSQDSRLNLTPHPHVLRHILDHFHEEIFYGG